jgi:hypothetical protein
VTRLAVLQPSPASAETSLRPLDWRRGRRWWTVLLGLAGAAAMMLSLTQVWWNFHMVAPQYPKGLDLHIRLQGVEGDTREVNIINHYIGMGHLEEAAAWERAHALPAVALAALAVALLLFGAGRRIGFATWVPAIAFPIGFLLDTLYWLHRFGHDLDPAAPITFPGFTPKLFGYGTIGQFQTWAWPGPGFFIAVIGAGLVLVAAIVRFTVCRACPNADNCGAVCPHGLVGTPREAR